MKYAWSKSKQKKGTETKAVLDPAKGLKYLFINELRDILWSEKALIKAFPKIITNAQSPEFINAVSDHLETTIAQHARIEGLFASLGVRGAAKKCDTIDWLIREIEQVIEHTPEGIVRDAGLISIAQKIAHYEIASYGILYAFAELLGETETAALLEKTLKEEKEADEVLTSIAKSDISLELSYTYMDERNYKRRSA